ncbi:MAG: hypothetical protein ACYDA3_07500 [Gaiellaceae bacterium]
MIAAVLIASLVIGRWWIITALVVMWTVLLLSSGTIRAADVPAAAGLAAVNAAVGVALHQAVLWLVRLGRRRPS